MLIFITLGRHGYHTHSAILYWDYIERNIQLVPMRTISGMVQSFLDSGTSSLVRTLSFVNLAGNIIMFIPAGFFLSRGSLSKCIQKALLLTLLVEIVQVFTLRGSFDIDDIMLNVAGAIIGYFLWKKLKIIFER